jgi:hypothetical protein
MPWWPDCRPCPSRWLGARARYRQIFTRGSRNPTPQALPCCACTREPMPRLGELRSGGGSGARSYPPGCDTGGSRANAVGLRDTGVPIKEAERLRLPPLTCVRLRSLCLFSTHTTASVHNRGNYLLLGTVVLCLQQEHNQRCCHAVVISRVLCFLHPLSIFHSSSTLKSVDGNMLGIAIC